MWFGIVSLFPEMFQALNYGIVKRAIDQQLITLHTTNPRDFAEDKYQTVDDYVYGGGPGLLMKINPLKKALEKTKAASPTPPTVVYVSPQGKLFNQAMIPEIIAKKSLIFLSGRYEGIDERLIQSEVDEEWSIGDYILSGGELPTMVMIDAITRLIPGTLGNAQSYLTDSLSAGLLKYPQYTRPECFAGLSVPDVLVNGNHQAIAQWRLKQSLGRTWQKRPDLLAKKRLNSQENKLLAEFIAEFKGKSR